MLPGQIGLLIIGIVSVLALAVLGVFSYLAFDKEKKQKEKEARAKRREQWHESMKATADEDLSGTFDEVREPTAEPEEELPQQEAYELAEDEFLAGFDPFAAPEKEAPAPAPEVAIPAPEPPAAKPAAPAAPERPKSTRNDFDFKF